MTAPTPSRPARPQRPQAVLHVEEAHALPSGLHRVVVGGPGFAQYADNGFADRYAKLLFADPEHGLEQRIRAYSRHGYFSPAEADDLIAAGRAARVEHPQAILARFAERYGLRP